MRLPGAQRRRALLVTDRARLVAAFVIVASTALLVTYASTWLRLDRINQERSDFAYAYVGGQIWREGHGDKLYDAAVDKAYYDRDVAPNAQVDLPFIDAPTAAPLLAPFTLVDIRTGWRLWSGLQLVLLLAALVIASRSARWQPRTPRDSLLAAALAGAAGAGTYVLAIQGQWSGLLALGLALAHAACSRGRNFIGGALLTVTLLSIKPNFAIGAAVFLVGWRERRLVAGAVAGAAGVVLASLLVAGPAGCLGFLRTVAESTQSWPWSSMNSASGLVASWFGDNGTTATIGLVACLLAATSAYPFGRAVARDISRLDVAFAGAVAATLLASPHLYHHDLTLLAPALVWGTAAASRLDHAATARAGRRGQATMLVFGLWGVFTVVALQQLGAPLIGFPGRLVPWVIGAMLVLALVACRTSQRRRRDRAGLAGLLPADAPTLRPARDG
ncbi:MAG: DUF2029 domain-containing protein [Chloroflexi bacterium]|nr:MAG: DUF2029 domain-containing protein [Chloroflexota bacterium]